MIVVVPFGSGGIHVRFHVHLRGRGGGRDRGRDHDHEHLRVPLAPLGLHVRVHTPQRCAE